MTNLFDFTDEEALGAVISVDTATVIVRIDDLEKLKRLQVNRLVVLQSSKAGNFLIGIVQKITRKPDATQNDGELDEILPNENNLVRISLIGTMINKSGSDRNIFRRTLEVVPDIDAFCFALEGERLTKFMQVISAVKVDGPTLELGHFTLDDSATAYLNGNKLFQRHAFITGSTGSGKSWTTAKLVEQIAKLPQANAVLFDIHGEYNTLESDEFRHLKIAGPSEMHSGIGLNDGVMHLPYWLLGYEALVSMLVDRTDQNAPNQSMVMTRIVLEAKRRYLEEQGATELLENLTIDSPVPFSLEGVQNSLNATNVEMVTGSNGREKQGPFNGKLSRLISRLEAKTLDRRLGFLFSPPIECMNIDWLEELVCTLLAETGAQRDGKGGVKIIDFSEVPADILPLIVSLMADIVFSASLWTTAETRHPIALLCDEAHLYIPHTEKANASASVAVELFERIAKEGRKYGIGLVIISQRPSELNRTVLSQCSNVIAMRLSNADDQNVVKRLLPDSLGGFAEILPVLDVGEAVVVGDASLLPSRIRVSEPKYRPNSQTVPFWDRWNQDDPVSDIATAVQAWRRQSSN